MNDGFRWMGFSLDTNISPFFCPIYFNQCLLVNRNICGVLHRSSLDSIFLCSIITSLLNCVMSVPLSFIKHLLTGRNKQIEKGKFSECVEHCCLVFEDLHINPSTHVRHVYRHTTHYPNIPF
jgi:hypothetical protein